MQKSWSPGLFARMMGVSWVMFSVACGSDDLDGGDPPGEALAPHTARSSVTDESGDGELLAQLERLHSQFVCLCEETEALSGVCLEAEWPEGRVECLTRALDANAAVNREAVACAIEAASAVAACVNVAYCNAAALDACERSFEVDRRPCPSFAPETKRAIEACARR